MIANIQERCFDDAIDDERRIALRGDIVVDVDLRRNSRFGDEAIDQLANGGAEPEQVERRRVQLIDETTF